MKNQTVTIEAAAAMHARKNEIPRLIEQIEPELSNHKTEIDNLSAQIANMQRVLDEENAPRVLGEMRHNPMRQPEKDEKAAHIRQLKTQLGDALKTYEPLRNEVDALNAEREKLENNPPAVTLQDLKTAQAKTSALTIKLDQIKQAAEEAASKSPADRIESLQEETERLSADQDLMAADVDMGHGSDDELKKLTGKLAKLKKELFTAQEVAGMAQATQRGYQRRIDTLNDELAAADAGLKALITLYARRGYETASERLQAAIADIGEALDTMSNHNQLSQLKGDGSEFFPYSASIRIELRGIAGVEDKLIEPDTDAARDNAEQVVLSLAQA